MLEVSKEVVALSTALTHELRGGCSAKSLQQDGEKTNGEIHQEPVTQVVSKPDGTDWCEWPDTSELPKTQTGFLNSLNK